MRYRLRTILIVLAVLPPLLAMGWWQIAAWRAERARREEQRAMTEWLLQNRSPAPWFIPADPADP